MSAPPCHVCGSPVRPDNLAWDYEWPAPLAKLPADRLIWRSEAFIRTRDLGCAIREILPVRLGSGHTSTLGVWLSLKPDDAKRVYDAASTGGDAWDGCRFTGPLLNDVSPWETRFAEATAVASAGRPARLVASPDPTLSRVLGETRRVPPHVGPPRGPEGETAVVEAPSLGVTVRPWQVAR